jgi:hypothetical protein
MDLHKPKPWHGVREFLKEYVIIVVGVLTALAAEQGVEWLHWSQKVANTESALRMELASVQADAQERIAVERCVDRRIDQLERRVIAAEGPLKPEPYWQTLAGSLGGTPYRIPIRAWGAFVWEAANADGTVSHIARDRMLKYAQGYRELQMIRTENEREFATSSDLGVLQHGAALTASDKTRLLEVLEQLRRDNALIVLQAGQVVSILKGMLPPPPGPTTAANSSTFGTCVDLGLLK